MDYVNPNERDDADERAAMAAAWIHDGTGGAASLARAQADADAERKRQGWGKYSDFSAPVEHYRAPAPSYYGPVVPGIDEEQPPDYGPVVTYSRGGLRVVDGGKVDNGRLATIEPHRLQGLAVPERRWVVRDWIPDGAVTMLGGDGGVGKSLLAMQLITSVATGKAWLGRAITPCRALGLFCEDDREELHRRQDDINKHFGIEFSDLENMTWLPRVGEDNALMVFDSDRGTATELYQRVRNLALDRGARIIVLDALHDIFAGNENARPQARQFINLLHSLAMDIGGAVVLTAHPSLTGLSSGSGLSGSTAWNNAVRSRLYLTRPEGDDDTETDDRERVLRRVKANYAGMGDELTLRWQDGVFHAEQPDATVFGGIEKSRAETAFLDGLDALEKQGRRGSPNKNQPSYAPKLVARLALAKGLKVRDLDRAMDRLLETGEVQIVTEGPPSRSRQFITRKAEQ